jgi:hypothetical protein
MKSKKTQYKLLKDITNCGAKAGMLFEWDNEEGAYTTKDMPWYLTPMISYFEIKKWSTKKRGLFEKINKAHK